MNEKVFLDEQKEIKRLLDSLAGRYSRWEVWNDFIVMTACSISNSIDLANYNDREKKYLERSKKYTSDELLKFAQMYAQLVNALEKKPDQDFLGDLFMAMNFGNDASGQFFTPYSVCSMTAQMNVDSAIETLKSKSFISCADVACGAGALLIAFANDLRAKGVNYQEKVLFVAQDIDYLAGLMCYIQLSLLGCPGYVVIGDTLSAPVICADAEGLVPINKNVWFTPLYVFGGWRAKAKSRMEVG